MSHLPPRPCCGVPSCICHMKTRTSHFILPPSFFRKTLVGDFAGLDTHMARAVLWLSAGDKGDQTESPSFATLVNRGNTEPITLCGLPIIVSRVMPDNVAFYLISHTNNLRGLSMKVATCTWTGNMALNEHIFSP